MYIKRSMVFFVELRNELLGEVAILGLYEHWAFIAVAPNGWNPGEAFFAPILVICSAIVALVQLP
jgi:hypothetical protein